jgi:hypothetical protein
MNFSIARQAFVANVGKSLGNVYGDTIEIFFSNA